MRPSPRCCPLGNLGGVGPEGGEVLGLLSVAVQARVPVRELGSTIFAYPTFHRGVADALRALADDRP